MPWLIPEAVGDEPMPKPISMLPAAIPVFISAPLPTSIQFTLAPAACWIEPPPFAIMSGLVDTKKAKFADAGAARAIAGAARAAAPSPAPCRRRRRVVSVLFIWVPASLSACAVHPARFGHEQKPLERDTHEANDENADEDVIRTQEPSRVENHPADAGGSGDNLAGDQSRIDDADTQPRAGEDLGQRRGKHDMAEYLPLAGAERLRNAHARLGDIPHPVARGHRRDRQGGEEQQGDFRGFADAEPDDQQHEIGELRQRPEEFDERRRERIDDWQISHQE